MMFRHRMRQDKRDLEKINEQEDSLRFYYLGNKYQTKVEHFGTKTSYEAEGVLMI